MWESAKREEEFLKALEHQKDSHPQPSRQISQIFTKWFSEIPTLPLTGGLLLSTTQWLQVRLNNLEMRKKLVYANRSGQKVKHFPQSDSPLKVTSVHSADYGSQLITFDYYIKPIDWQGVDCSTSWQIQDIISNCPTPCVKPWLNQRWCQRRLFWTKDQKDWAVAQWSNVLV